jgi:hypothetical protein
MTARSDRRTSTDAPPRARGSDRTSFASLDSYLDEVETRLSALEGQRVEV